MTHQHRISCFISSLCLSLILLGMGVQKSQAQSKLFAIAHDSVPLFKGFQLSFDLVGPAMRSMGDYGEYEGALRINLHDQYFPVVEIGYGTANHSEDEVTGLSYKTQAPYFRIGCDLNLLRNKHRPNKLYGGIRYAFTSYKVDVSRVATPDPVWGNETIFNVEGEACSQHWIELVLGLDAQLWGPLHAGWAVRYKRRISHSDMDAGNTWYVPGYVKAGDTRIGVNFNVIIDI